MDGDEWPQSERIVDVALEMAAGRAPLPDMEHERAVAIADLLQENRFSVPAHAPGPYRLRLSLNERQLFFDIADEEGRRLIVFGLSLGPLRRVLRDYFRICESYFDAIRSAPAHRIEPIDMARRAVHDEGAEILRQRLSGKIEMDKATARRLFTLINLLHWQGR